MELQRLSVKRTSSFTRMQVDMWALLKTIPLVVELINRFVTWYIQHEYESMLKEHRDVIESCIKKNDQRPVENLLSGNAGQPSHIPGVTIRPSIPGTQK